MGSAICSRWQFGLAAPNHWPDVLSCFVHHNISKPPNLMKTQQHAFRPDPSTSEAASMPGRLADQATGARRLGTLIFIGDTPDSQAGFSSGLRGLPEPHETSQLVPASFGVSLVCALLLGSIRLVSASDPSGTEGLSIASTLFAIPHYSRQGSG